MPSQATLATRFKRLPLAAALGVITATGAVPSLAQDSEMTLEEVIVTAQKRSQSLQDVPIAITAFSNDGLRQAMVYDIGDLAPLTPGFNTNVLQPAFPELFIRGIGSSDFGIGADPSIGIFIDGVYMGRSGGAVTQLQDIARVEVLKGPQGTLFGRNTAAGAISMTTFDASEDIPNTLGVKAGNHNHREVYGGVSFPLVEDKLWFRFSGMSASRDGWQDNATTGAEGGELDRWTYRATLTWKPTEEVRVNLTADNSKAEENTGYWEVSDDQWGLVNFGVYDPLALDYEDEKAAADSDPRTKREPKGAALTVDWEINDSLSFTSITGYREYETTFQMDLDASSFPLAQTVANIESSEAWSQEFRLNSSSENLDWFVGVSYYDEDTGLNVTDALNLQSLELITESSPSAGDGFICFGSPGCTSDILPGFTAEQVKSSGHNESLAIYGDATWRATDRLSLTVGIRYSEDDKELQHGFNASNFGFIYLPPEGGTDLGSGFIGATQDDSWSNTSPRFVVDYALTDDFLMYGSYTKGYKSGGFNTFPSGSFNDLDSADEETVDSYELGVKTTWLDSRLQANIAAFYYEYDDLQVIVAQNSGGVTSFVLDNEGKAEGQGLEAELSFLPVQDLTLSLMLAYLDTEIKEGENEGKDLPRAPEFSGAVGVDYFLDLDNLGEIRFNASYAYVGDNQLTLSEFPVSELTTQDSYELLNSRITWSLGEERPWQIALWGTNLTDEVIRVTAYDSLSFVGLYSTQRNTPRMYGIDVSYSF